MQFLTAKMLKTFVWILFVCLYSPARLKIITTRCLDLCHIYILNLSDTIPKHSCILRELFHLPMPWWQRTWVWCRLDIDLMQKCWIDVLSRSTRQYLLYVMKPFSGQVLILAIVLSFFKKTDADLSEYETRFGKEMQSGAQAGGKCGSSKPGWTWNH